MIRSLSLAAVVLCATLVSGCAGLSFQHYGPISRGHQISTGTSRADILAGIGEPDAKQAADGGWEVYIYRNLKGANYFGLYSKTKRFDTVVVFNGQGIVESITEVDYGMGHTYFSSPAWLNATHPVPTTELYPVGARKHGAN
jgi:hypothetical protein